MQSSVISELLRKSYPLATKICTSPESVKTLYDFLASSKNDELSQAIKEFLKQALLSTPNDLASNLSNLLTMIPSEQVLYLPKDCSSDLCLALINIQKNTTCLIVPDYFNPNNYKEHSPQLSVGDAKIILQKLNDFAKDNITFVEKYALNVIDWSEQPDLLIQDIQSLSLFSIQIIGKENQQKLTTLEELQKNLAQKRLFSKSNQPLLKILSQAIEWEV